MPADRSTNTTSTARSATTSRAAFRRTAVAGALALVVLGGTTAAGTSAAIACPAKPAPAPAARTTDFGFLTKVTGTGKGVTLTLDRAILHTGKAAARQRAARGLDSTPDFYLQNDNPLLRTFRVAPDVRVYGSQLLTGSPARKPTTLARLRTFLASRPKGVTGPPFTLVLDRNRRVVQITEMYLP